MTQSNHIEPCERLETFEDWLQRYRVQTRRFGLSSDDVDRLYSLYLTDWSVASAAALDAGDGLKPIGPHIAAAVDRIHVAYDAAHATPAEIAAMISVPAPSNMWASLATFLCGAVFGIAALGLIVEALKGPFGQ